MPLQSRAKESAWIDRHRDEYLGQWVAIEGICSLRMAPTLVKFIWRRARPESPRPLLSAWKSVKTLSWEAGSDL